MKQTAAVENFITQKYDVIVIAPADSRAMVAPIAKALKAGITVVNFDVALDPAAMKKAGLDLAFVGPDNRGGARLAGDELAKALGPGAKIVIIEGNPGADNALQRKLGFEDAAKAGKLNVVASQTAHWETEEANAVFTRSSSMPYCDDPVHPRPHARGRHARPVPHAGRQIGAASGDLHHADRAGHREERNRLEVARRSCLIDR